jgi:succinate dehydrogenase/fumarate reductase cytochrome b subunit
MNPTVAKAMLALLVTGSLCGIAARGFLRRRATGSLLELIGAAALVIVGVTHLCEGLHLLPWMQWGMEDGPGHYLNLASVATGLVLLPAGFLLNKRRA